MATPVASAETNRARSRLRWARRLVLVALLVESFLLLGAFAYAWLDGRFDEARRAPTPTGLAAFGVGEMVVTSYVLWAAFWGVPPVWRRWRELLARLRSHPLGRWLPPPSLPTLLPYSGLYAALLAVGLGYGVFGGGLYQYLKARRIAGVADRPAAPGAP